jgi:flagellar protein FliL
MSAAAAAPAGDAAPKKGKKKLIIIIVAVVLLLAIAGGGALFFMKKKQAEEEAAAEGDGTAHVEKKPKKEKKKDDKHALPVFVPLDPFVVNLADREVDRYAQIGITLQVEDAKVADEIKAYLPAIRNNILLLLAHKTAEELMTADGKEKLARQVLRQSVLPMGIELEDEDEVEAEPVEPGKKRKKRQYDSIDDSPVKAVQFASFIIQ